VNALRVAAGAVGVIAGIVVTDRLDDPTPVPVLVLALLTGTALGLWMWREERLRWRAWPRWAVAGAMLLAAYPVGAWRMAATGAAGGPDALRTRLEALPDGTEFAVRGTVAREPEIRSGTRTDLQLRVREFRVGPDGPWEPVTSGRLLVRLFRRVNSRAETVDTLMRVSDPRAYGDLLEIPLRTGRERAMLNPGQFDHDRFLDQQGLEASLSAYAGRVTVLESRRGNPIVALALAAKRRFLETYRVTIRSPASRLAAAATLGSRRALDGVMFRGRPIPDLFRHAGVGHVLAVSGLHVSVITVLLYVLFRMVGLRPRLFVPPLIVFLILFAILTGARPSSVRAVIMNSVILGILAYGHGGLRQATAAGLGLSAVGILLHHPLVLYAPSFLLSYGAVLSLLVFAPPLDRVLLKLRGYGLLWFGLWFTALMLVSAFAFHILLSVPVLLVALALLWGGVLAGHRLNDRFPRAWQVGLHRLPGGLRIFLSAQLAIQAGMMIPMSAWFFGQLPVAGVLVNLLAIPLVGVLVQLGMLTGLLGLIPGIGLFLAAPFGAACTLVGEGFLHLAATGAILFPFPAVPQPTLGFLVGYYLVLVSLVLLARRRAALAALLDAVARRPRLWRTGCIAAWGLPILLALLSLSQLAVRRPEARAILCLADGDLPVVAVVSDAHAAVLINAGGAMTGRFLLFDALRHAGAVRIETAILPATRPRSGIEGIVTLGERMTTGRVLLPVLPNNPMEFTAAIGDDYLTRRAATGERWAVAHDTAYAALDEAAGRQGFRLDRLTAGPLPLRWRELTITVLPEPEVLPDRFVQSARTPVVTLDFHGTRWVILTDSTPEAVAAMPPPADGCDVLLLPDYGSRHTYPRLVATAIETFRPRVVIVCGDRPPSTEPDFPTGKLIATGRDGAVTARPARPSGVVLETHVTGRRIVL